MLKVDIRNRILKPKVGEIITVIGDIYTTVAETIPDENGRCESCAFNDKTISCINGDACEKCVFSSGELANLCWRIWCFNGDGSKLTFRRVRNGEI